MDDRQMGSEVPAPPRRRRDDLTNTRTMLDSVRFLMTRPTCDQIAQQLVLNLLAAHQPRTAVITLFGADGSLHAVGAFGMSAAGLELYRTLSLWDASPMSDAVRSGDPILMTTVDEVESSYPWLGSKEIPYEPMAVWPLSLPSQRVGALQLTFTSPPAPEQLRADATGIAAVLALYLSLLTSGGSAADRSSGGIERDDRQGQFTPATLSLVESTNGDEVASGAPRRSAPGALSDRQLRILALMAKGLTNSQISKRVGFSESTVRQETMAIYRYFGVGGRREAVRLAGMRGMLDANAG